jgi:hypothetical protein
VGITTSKITSHWNYFLAIERDLEVLSRFIEFDERNFDCFSLEIARILLAAGAEVDVVCKQICRAKDPDSVADNIQAYRNEIVSHRSAISQFAVEIPRFGLSLHPWDEWKKPDGVPAWWTAHNKIKHHRHSHYDHANLKNALNGVAGLFVATLYLYQEQAEAGELVPTPQLLRPGLGHFDGMTAGDYDVGINYTL